MAILEIHSLRAMVRPVIVLAMAAGLAACGGDTADTTVEDAGADPSGAADLSGGSVAVDGSSTVFPISEAMAEEFMAANPGVQVTVGVSGSGGGFEKFCAGETDISNASRPIQQEEVALCEENGIEFVEIPISFDGLSVVVNPENDFVQCLTVQELETMWEPDAQGVVTNWNQIRPDFPDAEIGLYGPGTASGTYDYFTQAIMGEEGASRGDFTASEDDNVLVQGVSSDPNAIGFFGYAYYFENQDQLKLVAIDNGDGCVEPSEETIADGSYQPLARPEFFYVKKESLENNPAVEAFARFQIDPDNAYLIEEVGYVPLPDEIGPLANEKIDNLETGSAFPDGSAVGVKIEDEL